MSLINKMLQELDKRHAVDEAGKPSAPAGAKALAQQLRPVKAGRDFGEAFWRVMAGLMVVVVCWIAWLLWQITPKSVVTELAFQAAAKPRSEATPATKSAAAPVQAPEPAVVAPAPPAATASAPEAAPPPATKAPVAASPVPVVSAPASATPQAIAPTKPSEPLKIDMLRLATEITTPIPERRSRVANAKPDPKPPKANATTDAKTLAALPPPTPAPQAAAPPRPEPVNAAPKPAVGEGKIDRRNNASVRDRADAEFRRATAFVSQGRISEAMEALTAALSIDPGYEAARQTAVGLQLENRHVDDAQRLLQDGLALNPSHAGFAMLLARIQVERGDLNGGLATLQRHGAGASGNADYLAFSAAILQRLSRHKEAVDIYQSVLRLQPGSGVWWMGLGISLQAQKQPSEAAEAFKRARSSGTLSPELLAFVDQRIRQLQ